MRIEISIRDDLVRVGLSEHLTVDDHETLRTLLAAFAEAEEARCVLDLRELESIDPVGRGLVREAEVAADRACRAFAVHRLPLQVCGSRPTGMHAMA